MQTVSEMLDAIVMADAGYPAPMTPDELRDMERGMGRVKFSMEMRTRGLALARRTGKSWGIGELFNNYRASYGHDTQYLVVQPNRGLRANWLRGYMERYPFDRDACDCVLTPYSFTRPGTPAFAHSDIVFIDEPDCFGGDDLIKVYEHLPASLYLQVGTPLYPRRG